MTSEDRPLTRAELAEVKNAPARRARQRSYAQPKECYGDPLERLELEAEKAEVPEHRPAHEQKTKTKGKR